MICLACLPCTKGEFQRFLTLQGGAIPTSGRMIPKVMTGHKRQSKPVIRRRTISKGVLIALQTYSTTCHRCTSFVYFCMFADTSHQEFILSFSGRHRGRLRGKRSGQNGSFSEKKNKTKLSIGPSENATFLQLFFLVCRKIFAQLSLELHTFQQGGLHLAQGRNALCL